MSIKTIIIIIIICVYLLRPVNRNAIVRPKLQKYMAGPKGAHKGRFYGKKQQDYSVFLITPNHTWKYMEHNMEGVG